MSTRDDAVGTSLSAEKPGALPACGNEQVAPQKKRPPFAGRPFDGCVDCK
jgi:hypothetical protein